MMVTLTVMLLLNLLEIYLFKNLHNLAQVFYLLVKVLLIEDAFSFLRVRSLFILLLLINGTLLFLYIRILFHKFIFINRLHLINNGLDCWKELVFFFKNLFLYFSFWLHLEIGVKEFQNVSLKKMLIF